MTTKILVADDSTTIQKVIRLAFSRYPLQLVYASSLLEARNILQQEPIDLVLMDSCLPGVTSKEHIDKFMQDHPSLAFVFLIGSFKGIDLNALASPQKNQILKKPFEPSQIVDVVRQVLGRPFDPDHEQALEPKATKEPVSQPAAMDLGGIDQQQLSQMVRSAVYDYCDSHFESLIKDVITAEIRQLMDKKARQLVDN